MAVLEGQRGQDGLHLLWGFAVGTVWGSGCAETRHCYGSGMNAPGCESIFCVSGSCLSQLSQRIISVQGFHAGEEKPYETAVE